MTNGSLRKRWHVRGCAPLNSVVFMTGGTRLMRQTIARPKREREREEIQARGSMRWGLLLSYKWRHTERGLVRAELFDGCHLLLPLRCKYSSPESEKTGL
jgi:hypothetical protein